MGVENGDATVSQLKCAIAAVDDIDDHAFVTHTPDEGRRDEHKTRRERRPEQA